MADKLLALNNNIVKGDIFDGFVVKMDDNTIATFKLTITQNGVYPPFPDLVFKSEKRVIMVENGIVKNPADVISAATFKGVSYLASDFDGSLLVNKPKADLDDDQASFTFINQKN